MPFVMKVHRTWLWILDRCYIDKDKTVRAAKNAAIVRWERKN